MLKHILNLIILAISASAFWYSYTMLTGRYLICGIFFAGLAFGVFLMNIRLHVKNDKLNLYKRELEKEAISSTESDARVKVLEAKIEVLEKALENALAEK